MNCVLKLCSCTSTVKSKKYSHFTTNMANIGAKMAKMANIGAKMANMANIGAKLANMANIWA